MSDVFRLALFALLGIGIGAVAFACLEKPAAPPQTSPSTVAASIEPAPAPPVPEPRDDVDEPKAVAVTMTPSRVFGSDLRVYAHFVLTPADEAVQRVRLNVEPGPGVSVVDVFGPDWERHADGVAVEIGELEAPEHLVVELRQRVAGAGTVVTNVSHRATEATESLVAATDPVSRDIVSTSPQPAVEVFVSQAMTNRALDRAEQLRDGGDLQQAFDTLEHARGRNVEIGLALRVAGKLKAEQSRLRRLRDEIEREMNRPRRRRRPDNPGIAILYGDGS